MSSWGFGNLSQEQGQAQQVQQNGSSAQAGDELRDIETADLAFQDVASTLEARLRVSEPWPAEQLPATTASLLSIASNKGLVAAAGPDSLLITSTEKTRRQYLAKRDENDESDKTRLLQPDIKLSIPRISHVAFSSDESCLVIAAEQGGGLAIYDTNNLSNTAQPAFSISTNGTSVRHVLPNPNPGADFSHYFGLVLSDGKLLLADLKNRTLVNTANGNPIFFENVTSAAWSKLGKQIIAGLADSTAAQIDPQGNLRDRIPRPPQLAQLQNDYEGAHALPISAITWISTFDFLLIFSPVYPAGKDGIQDSIYFMARRSKTTPFTFHKFSMDPCSPFGMVERTPAQHFLLRLFEWTGTTDIIIAGSTASTDIGLFTQFKADTSKGVADEFVTVTIKEEIGGRAILPLNSETGSDTSATGMALDLGSKEVAPRPVHNEEDFFPHSTIPLPALYVLNNEGILLMWWVINADAIRKKDIYSGMVSKTGRFAKYKKFNKFRHAIDEGNPHVDEADRDVSDDETDLIGDASAISASPALAPAFGAASSQKPQHSGFGQSGFALPQQPAFGQSSFASNSSINQTNVSSPAPGFGNASALGQKKNPWGSPSAAPNAAQPILGHSFGQPSFGSPSTPIQPRLTDTTPTVKPNPFAQGGQSSSTPSGKPATPGFGQVSQLGGGSSFGKPSPLGGGSLAAQSSPSPHTPAFGQASKPFGGNTNSASPFLSVSSKTNEDKPNPFAAWGKQKPSLSQEASTGSTATLGSSGSGSFGTGSAFAGSSFGSKPAFSKESTVRDDEDGTKAATPQQSGSLFGLGASGFKLGSGFKGDGSATNDGPKPANPGAGLFGAGFGASLNDTTSKEPTQKIKQEAGAQEGISLREIPPVQTTSQVQKDAAEPPLPPDFTKSRSSAVIDDAPLPPDPSTYKAPKVPDDLPLPPDFGPSGSGPDDRDIPIAGSPPVDVTNSQTFSQAGDSEHTGPAEDDDDDWEGESAEEDQEDGDEEEEEGDDSGDDGENEEDDEPYVTQDPAGLAAFHSRLSPPSPKATEAPSQHTPPSDPKTEKSSYTPAGLPKGPVFPPPSTRAQHSPRSPSPQRAVTSPVARGGFPSQLPPEIQTSAIPAPKIVERKAAPPKQREPTEEELQDEADAQLKAYLAGPPEPKKTLPQFFTHAEYEGAVQKDGVGGQIEKVFRDVNSMVDVVGLNAKSLENFLVGHQTLRSEGERKRDDLDNTNMWCLGDLADLNKLLHEMGTQLEEGKLENVQEKLSELAEEQKDTLKLESLASEIRRFVGARSDPDRVAMQEAAQLPADAQAQQIELRQSVQRVQKLLSEVEEKMTLMRADLVSLSSSTNRHPDGRTTAAVPTVENVMNTIVRMTAMIEEKSGDVDLLEAQIRRLPNGIASLRMPDGYEDDLASRLAGNNLLANNSSSTTTTRTPPRWPRMAANGDQLGMSAMFGVSGNRFKTPPSASFARMSLRHTPGGHSSSELRRSLAGGGSSASGARNKKMADVTREEIEEFHAKAERRKMVLGALKGKLEVRGPRVVRVS